MDGRNDERVSENILQGRYAAALFSAANKNGSLDAVEKVGSLDRGPLFLSVKQAYLMSSFFFCQVPLLIGKGLLTDLAQDLKSISSTMESDPRLGSFLLDPSIKKWVSTMIHHLILS